MTRTAGSQGVAHLTRVVLPAALPALVTLALAAVIWQATPRDFVPLWNDEVMYWNESAAFMRAGFDGGYITVSEQPARAAFSHFGPHGIGYAMFYGTVGRLVGWHPNSQYLTHLVLVPACAWAWFWMRRRAQGRLREALLLATFWPLLFYLPTGMTEPLNFGIAILCAALLERASPGPGDVVARVALLAVATFLRPTWALVAPALLWECIPRRRAWRLGLVSGTALCFVGAYVVQTWMSAPYPQLTWRGVMLTHPLESIGQVLVLLLHNVGQFLRPGDEWYITLYRAEMVLFMAALAVFGWRHVPEARPRLVLAFWLVVPPLMVQLVGADVESGRDLRIVMGHTLAALLVLAGASRWWAIIPVAIHLLVLPTVYPDYVDNHDGRFTRAAEVDVMARATHGALAFDPSAASGWDNTILMHADAMTPAMVAVPPGVGISFVLDWQDQATPPKSRWVWLREQDAFSTAGLVAVARSDLGTLYRRGER